MATDSTRSLREELPAHGAWVRRLARSLVRDEASADDLAQDAMLAALRRADSSRADSSRADSSRADSSRGDSNRGALEPWLTRVTRNFARRGWRDAARRSAREHGAARPEGVPGADEAAARLEIQRLLIEELSALAPPLRHTLVRRYFDGWSAARIARESGEPAPTVRWRLQRALAELRARLDRRSGGDGAQWRLALLPVCGGATPWPAALERALEALRPLTRAGAIQGALTMKAVSQALTAGTVVAALGLGVWWSVGREETPRAADASGPPQRMAELQEPTRREDATLEVPAAARESLASSPSAPSAVPTPAPAPAGARIVGRAVDEQLVPVGGTRVSQQGDPTRATLGAADGAFELGVQPSRSNACTLLIEAESFATRFLEVTLQEHEAKSVGDVVLQPGGSLRGRVFGPDGAPFAGASVSVTQPDLRDSLENARIHGPRGTECLSTLSEVDGRFEVHGAGVGPVRAWAGARDMRYAVSPLVEVRARQTTDEVELHLEPVRGDDRIRGIVLSPEGAPVPGAGLGCLEHSGGGETSFNLKTDAEGRFEIVAKVGRVYDLGALDPAQRWSSVKAAGVQPGTHDLELRFEEARWIEVSVNAQEGELGELVVQANSPDDGWIASAKETARLDGRVHTRLLLPTEGFLVQVDARGFRLDEQGPFRPESAPTSLDFELVPEPGVRGRVVAGGEPVAGARVALHRASPGARIEHQGYLTLVDPRAEDKTSTDADGRFTLKLREPDTYVVRAEAPGYAASDSGALELAPESGRSGLELALGRGGSLAGRVRVAPGLDPSGVIVSLNRGDAFPRTLRSDSEGRFGFEGLTAGPWQLARGRMEFNPKGGGTSYSGADEPIVLPFNCTIVEGETTYQDLDLSDYEPCRLLGALRVNGAPATGWGVSGWPGGASAMVGNLPSSATAADGTFALTIEEAGPLRLSFSPPAESGGEGRIDVRIEIHPGPNAWQEDFQMGRLVGRCMSRPAGKELVLFYNSAEGVEPSCWLSVQPDEGGNYVLPFVPAGKGSIRYLDRSGETERWTTLIETEVLARRERVLDVP